MSDIGEQHYAASPDGQSFIMMPSRGAGGEIHVVVNWFDELTCLVPGVAKEIAPAISSSYERSVGFSSQPVHRRRLTNYVG